MASAVVALSDGPVLDRTLGADEADFAVLIGLAGFVRGFGHGGCAGVDGEHLGAAVFGAAAGCCCLMSGGIPPVRLLLLSAALIGSTFALVGTSSGAPCTGVRLSARASGRVGVGGGRSWSWRVVSGQASAERSTAGHDRSLLVVLYGSCSTRRMASPSRVAVVEQTLASTRLDFDSVALFPTPRAFAVSHSGRTAVLQIFTRLRNACPSRCHTAPARLLSATQSNQSPRFAPAIRLQLNRFLLGAIPPVCITQSRSDRLFMRPREDPRLDMTGSRRATQHVVSSFLSDHG